MLNDVHPPPLEPREPGNTSRNTSGNAAGHTPGHGARNPQATHPVRADRAHSLERTADHGMGTNLVFADPEDRGDSFNTIMSAVIVGSVLVTIVAIAWMMWT